MFFIVDASPLLFDIRDYTIKISILKANIRHFNSIFNIFYFNFKYA